MGSEDNEKKRKHEEEEERNAEEEDKLKKKKNTGVEAGKETGEGADGKDKTCQSKLDNVSSTPNHVAGKNLSEKCLKLAKRAAELKLLKRGLKEVSKTIRKQRSGLCFIAGNVSPVHVVEDLPILCEETKVPYVYLPYKEELGKASGTHRPTTCLLVLPSNPSGGAAWQGRPGEQMFKSDYDDIKGELEGKEAVLQ